MTYTSTWNCSYAVKTRSRIEYGNTSVDATSEKSAVVKITKKILVEKNDPYNSVVSIAINADHSVITEQYDEHAIKDAISESKR